MLTWIVADELQPGDLIVDAMSSMWAWFVMPVFTSAPRLDYLHAVGLNYIIGFSGAVRDAMNYRKVKDEVELSTTFKLVIVLFVEAFVLAGAAIWHQFIR